MNEEIKKKAWATKEAMEQVYDLKLWGNNGSNFYSGDGSHNPDIVRPYIEVVTTFLQSTEHQLVVCDLGCGDFNIGKQLMKYAEKYIAVDIVSSLISDNKEKFKAENLEFLCLDIAKDQLPKADCVILRQVLQHLSNAEIQSIVEKLNNFKYIILTEHLPEGEFSPNKNIISGQGIRLKKRSGVNLLSPPLNLKVKEEAKLLLFNLGNGKGVIATTLYRI